MLFIPPSDGPNLTAAQAEALDDEFFTSRPLSYFSARIAALLDERPHPENGKSRSAFFAALGLPVDAPLLTPTESDRHLQVAIDSMSARHHVAEALVRLLHALTDPISSTDGTSVWSLIADGPNGLHAVVSTVSDRFSADPNLFSPLFLAQGLPASEAKLAFEVALEWVRRAIHLVTSNELTVNAAHNKVKHGLAVRIRDDRRVEFVQFDPAKLSTEGTIPLSSIAGGVPIVDKPEVAYLARPYARPPQGLEVTSLILDAPVILAETWMMAVVYAALFHVAAAKHFGDREGDIAPYPTLHTGPTPDQILAGRVQGSREVLTTPPDTATIPRRSGLFHDGQFQPMEIDFSSEFSATIIDG
jgi:hypothetical protein